MPIDGLARGATRLRSATIRPTAAAEDRHLAPPIGERRRGAMAVGDGDDERLRLAVAAIRSALRCRIRSSSIQLMTASSGHGRAT